MRDIRVILARSCSAQFVYFGHDKRLDSNKQIRNKKQSVRYNEKRVPVKSTLFLATTTKCSIT